MPPLPRSALARASSSTLRQTRPHPPPARRYATPSTSSPTRAGEESNILLTAPSNSNKQEGVKLIKYAGKKKPITPGIRHSIQAHHSHLHPGSPLRDLTIPLRRSGGRNDTGQVVNRFVGGGHKRRIRIVDFMRREEGDHVVERVEYDPGRSAHIALIRKIESVDVGKAKIPKRPASTSAELPFSAWGIGSFQKPSSTPSYEHDKSIGGLSYILAPEGLRQGDIVRSYRSGIPSDIVEGMSSLGIGLDTDPSSPQTVNPPSSSSSSSSSTSNTSNSRNMGLLRTRTLKPGNVLPLRLCPPGTIIHNISTTPEGKMALCRSAGTFGQVIAHGLEKKEIDASSSEAAGSESNLFAIGEDGEDSGEGAGMRGSMEKEMTSREKNGWALVKMQSGEVRKLHPECVATVGTVSNKEHQQEQIGKAGRSRWLGRRPRVRGVAMNACDHPHGGGRGKSKGNRHPMSVWGWLTRGKRTRRPKDKDGNKMVVTERPRGRATATQKR